MRVACSGQISTVPEHKAKKPHLTIFQTMCFKVCLHQKTLQDCHAVSSHVYIQHAREHKTATELPLQEGLVFLRLCSSTMARGMCVPSFHGASFTGSHQANWSDHCRGSPVWLPGSSAPEQHIAIISVY